MSQAQKPTLLLSGSWSLLSLAYIRRARLICFSLFRHWIRLAFSLARARAGKSMEARIAMMAITTRSSMRVKAERFKFEYAYALKLCPGPHLIQPARILTRGSGLKWWSQD